MERTDPSTGMDMPADSRAWSWKTPSAEGHTDVACLHRGQLITEAMGRLDTEVFTSLDDGYCKSREPSEGS